MLVAFMNNIYFQKYLFSSFEDVQIPRIREKVTTFLLNYNAGWNRENQNNFR